MASIEERFGQRVRELRRERGWSQEDLAFRASLHRTYVSSMELGKRNVSIQIIQRLADAFAISIHSLMDV